MTSDATVAQAQRGDEEAFRELYRSVQPGLHRYLWTLVGEHAEDVASEAWLQIVRDLPRFRGDLRAFRGWAAKIARNRAMDHLRRRQRRPEELEPERLAEVAASDDTQALAIEAISTGAALALIAKLPQDQAEAVTLRVVLGLDPATAGKVLGKRAGAVRTATHRGLRRLAGILEEHHRARSAATDAAGADPVPSRPGKTTGEMP